MTEYPSKDDIFPDDCPVRLIKPFGLDDLIKPIEAVSDLRVVDQGEGLQSAISCSRSHPPSRLRRSSAISQGSGRAEAHRFKPRRQSRVLPQHPWHRFDVVI